MQRAVLKHSHRLLTLFHTRGLHAAVLAGLVMMPVVVATGFATDRLDAPRQSRPPRPELRGSINPLQHGPAALRP